MSRPNAATSASNDRPASPTPTTTPATSISARELHALLLEMSTSLNLTQRRFIDALRSLSEARLYLELGFPSIHAYAEVAFRIKKSQTYELLRVSEALASLPEIASAFEGGELSFSLTAKLTRVASAETEAEWLAHARERPVRETLAEIRDARKKNRDRPRKGSFGLPALPVRLQLEFSPEDHAVIEQGFAKVREEMAAGLDGKRPEPEKVLLYLMDRVLHEGPAPTSAPDGPDAAGGGAKTVADPARPSPYTVVFSQCTSCHRAAVETSTGRVEVEPESLERFSGSAETVVIEPERELRPGRSCVDDEDAGSPTGSEASAPEPAASQTVVPEEERAPPNSRRLRRELRARAGGRCENPYCRLETRGGGHAHHIIWRSAGGATELSNEVHVCERCHSLIHAGALALEGHPIDGLHWTPRAADLTREIRRELERARSLPEVCVVEDSVAQNPPAPSGCAESERGQESGRAPAVVDAIVALQELGFSAAEARERTKRAWARLQEERREDESREVDAGCLIKEVLRR